MKFMYWKNNKKKLCGSLTLILFQSTVQICEFLCIKIICLEIILCYQKASISTECFSLADHLVPQVWQYYPNPMQLVLTSGFWVNQVQNNNNYSAYTQSSTPTVSYLRSRSDMRLLNVKEAAVIFNTTPESC